MCSRAVPGPTQGTTLSSSIKPNPGGKCNRTGFPWSHVADSMRNVPWIYTLGMMRVMNLKIVLPMKQYGHPFWPMFHSMTQCPVHDIWMDLLNKGPKNLELTVHKPIEHHSMNSENLPLKWAVSVSPLDAWQLIFFWRKTDGIWFLDA